MTEEPQCHLPLKEDQGHHKAGWSHWSFPLLCGILPLQTLAVSLLTAPIPAPVLHWDVPAVPPAEPPSTPSPSGLSSLTALSGSSGQHPQALKIHKLCPKSPLQNPIQSTRVDEVLA